MPQFELTYYLSQAFWMVMSFGFLYLMMAYLICPMLEEVLSERQRLIQQELDKADILRRRADELAQRQHVFEMKVEAEKTQRIQNTFIAMQKKIAAKEARTQRDLQKRIRKTEEKMSALADEVSKEVEGAADEIADKLASRFFLKKETV